MALDILDIQSQLWGIADDLRSNSNLSQANYKTPVLGVIFLKHADLRFAEAERVLDDLPSRRRAVGKVDFQSRGVLYLPPESRYGYLQSLPEGEDLGKALNNAMKAIETENDELAGVLPKTFATLGNNVIDGLLRQVGTLLEPIDGDAYGKIYEYFLGKFAMGEGQRGGQFFTPSSLVKLIVEVIEPHGGRILDPACGSGGMFVQSAKFVERHRGSGRDVLSIYGQEKESDTVQLAKMNLAVNGLAGEIKEANSYYENPFSMVGAFDYIMANPPFNGNKVDMLKLKDDVRFPFGLPSVDNANYLWIQQFYSALNESGRAGFVMPNSAGDARSSEQTIRRRIIETGALDVVVSVSPNFFLTVTLPCTLWFFDRAKERDPLRKRQVLFIDARKVFTQVDRAHREFSPGQLEFLANIVRLYRGEALENEHGGADLAEQTFGEGSYEDVQGLCAVVDVDRIESEGWSLSPGRYVGSAFRDAAHEDFAERLEELAEEFAVISGEAEVLTEEIQRNLALLLGGDLE